MNFCNKITFKIFFQYFLIVIKFVVRSFNVHGFGSRFLTSKMVKLEIFYIYSCTLYGNVNWKTKPSSIFSYFEAGLSSIEIFSLWYRFDFLRASSFRADGVLCWLVFNRLVGTAIYERNRFLRELLLTHAFLAPTFLKVFYLKHC